MRCGHFADDQKEYVISTPFTPVKWINYVGTLTFGGIVDHTGGVLLCRGDPALNRITKYIPQLPASDFRGSTVYLRVKENDGYKIFSPFFSPTLVELDKFECRVGLGYSRWAVEALGLRVEITVFVPATAVTNVRDRVLIQDIRVGNLSGKPREVDVIPVVEFTHFDALKQLTNADWVPQTMILKAHVEGQTVLEQYAYMKRDTEVNWFTTSPSATSWDGDRNVFLGRYGYGSWTRPQGLANASLGNSVCDRGDNIGALLVPLGVLASGEEKRVTSLLGQSESLKAAGPAIAHYRKPDEVDRAFLDLAAGWKNLLDVLQIKTPDAAFDSMVNIHNPRQCHTTKNWSRDLSLYQLGLGGRGMGYRDSSQDVLGAMPFLPDECRDLVEKILSVQKREGNAMHQFYPLTMEANEGDSRESGDRPHWYGDDHLWPVFSVAAYLKETGDLAFLDKALPFYEKDADKKPLESTSVYEHLKRALAFTEAHKGVHGFPLLGFADWNDTVNLPTGAESLFVANQYGYALRTMKEIATAKGDRPYVQELERFYQEMREAVEKSAWDGAWYVRYFDHRGDPLGTHSAEKGRIWINSNTWAVMSGFASADRAKAAMDSVHEKLNTRFGLKLSAPGYDGFDPEIGGVTTYPPGAKENGGIFLHTNPWAMIAATILGDGDRAFQYYQQINPAAKNDSVEVYEAEPYCYPQNILGDEHPQYGLARNTWLSGTSSWTYVAATQWILGLRPEILGLRIDPCLPTTWEGFTATRKFRDAVYEIRVDKQKGISKGKIEVKLDRRILDDNLVPVQQNGRHLVEVTIRR